MNLGKCLPTLECENRINVFLLLNLSSAGLPFQFFLFLHSLALLLRNLIPPKPVFVETSEAIDHDGDWEGDDKDSTQCAQSARKLTQYSFWLFVVAHLGGHVD